MSQQLDIRTLSLEESWNTFKTEVSMASQLYKEARFGIEILFDINDHLKGRTLIKPKAGKVLIKGNSFDLVQYETELELRERLIKDWLLENLTDEDVATPRGINQNEQTQI